MTTYEDQERYLKESLKDVAKDLKFLRKKRAVAERLDSFISQNRESKGGIIYSADLHSNAIVQEIYFDTYVHEKTEEEIMEIISWFDNLLLSEGYSTNKVERQTYFDGMSLVYHKTGKLKTETGGEEFITLNIISHSPSDCSLISYEEKVTKYRLDCGKEDNNG